MNADILILVLAALMLSWGLLYAFAVVRARPAAMPVQGWRALLQSLSMPLLGMGLWIGLLLSSAGAVVYPGLLGVTGAKPDFNCARATTEVEHLLCSDERMGDADRLLAAQYQQALAANPGAAARDALRADQLRWLHQRDQQCGVAPRAWRSDRKIRADAFHCLGKSLAVQR